MNIRNLLCIAALFSLVVFCNSSALEVTGGVKCGLNLTKFYSAENIVDIDQSGNMQVYDPYEYQVLKPGFTIGATLQLKVEKMFAIHPELLFSAKGQKLQYGSNTQIINLNYLEIPILFEFLIPVRRVTPTLYAGPSFAVKLGKVNGKDVYDGEVVNWTDEERYYNDKSVNGFDFGLAIGGSIGFKAGPGNIYFDTRYTLGLTKIFKLTNEMIVEGITEDDIKNRNSALTFDVGYLFNF